MNRYLKDLHAPSDLISYMTSHQSVSYSRVIRALSSKKSETFQVVRLKLILIIPGLFLRGDKTQIFFEFYFQLAVFVTILDLKILKFS